MPSARPAISLLTVECREFAIDGVGVTRIDGVGEVVDTLLRGVNVLGLEIDLCGVIEPSRKSWKRPSKL